MENNVKEKDIKAMLEEYASLYAEYEQLGLILEDLKSKIEEWVKENGPAKYNGIRAGYRKGRNKYDWRGIVLIQEPDEEVIKKHTIEKTDWRKVAQEIGVPARVKERFTIVGEPKFEISLE